MLRSPPWSVRVVTLIGLASGASIALGVLVDMSRAGDTTLASGPAFSLERVLLTAALAALVAPVVLLVWRRAARHIVLRLPIPERARQRYLKHDAWTFVPLLLPLLGAIGLEISQLLIVALVGSVAVIQVFLLIYLADANEQAGAPPAIRWVTILFMASGFSALIYQVAWQRVLFGAFGVNIESVTIIVSIFMFGLGVGSLVGGRLSEVMPERLLVLFVSLEALIGMFGLISIPLINAVSALTVRLPLVGTSIAIYGLLSVPTLLMGASLPILVAYLHRHYGHVGTSVGNLYWINTLGAAAACFISVDLLFVLTGLQLSVVIAAMCNIAVAVLAYRQLGAAAFVPAQESA